MRGLAIRQSQVEWVATCNFRLFLAQGDLHRVSCYQTPGAVASAGAPYYNGGRTSDVGSMVMVHGVRFVVQLREGLKGYATRMIRGGFGGATINLVEASSTEAFAESVTRIRKKPALS
jgi:hypothetical protein